MVEIILVFIQLPLRQTPLRTSTTGACVAAPSYGFLPNTLKTLLGYLEYFDISRKAF